jgi:hypothetical protein
VSYLPIVVGGRGHGMETVAGSGRGPNQGNSNVVRVTSLANSGTGSLRWAVEQQGPKTIVFELSGYIELEEQLVIRTPYVTIAGQTAPSPGITVRGATVIVAASDVLIQHIRIRPGDDLNGSDPRNHDSLGIYNSTSLISRVVVDHCSLSWSTDEVLQIWSNTSDITIRRCLVSEGRYVFGGPLPTLIDVVGNYYIPGADSVLRRFGFSSTVEIRSTQTTTWLDARMRWRWSSSKVLRCCLPPLRSGPRGWSLRRPCRCSSSSCRQWGRGP